MPTDTYLRLRALRRRVEHQIRPGLYMPAERLIYWLGHYWKLTDHIEGRPVKF